MMFEVYALHRLRVENGEVSVEEIGAAAAADLPDRNREIFEAFLESMVERDEALGRAQSAWWTDGAPAEITSLLESAVEDFDAKSREAMVRLRACAPGNAMSGLVVFVRVNHDGVPQLLCMKLALSDVSIERFTGALSPTSAIAVEDIHDVLPKPKDLKKGALLPHPLRAADLKVVDEQMREAADYWLRFLGARISVKEPDVGRLVAVASLPVLEEANVEDASSIVAKELRRVAAAEKPQPVRKVVRNIAEAAGKEPSSIWKKVAEREPKLKDSGVRVSPSAAQRVTTEIIVDGGIKVSGPATKLEGRYEIINNPDGDGWILQIFTSQYPKITHRSRRGPIAS